MLFPLPLDDFVAVKSAVVVDDVVVVVVVAFAALIVVMWLVSQAEIVKGSHQQLQFSRNQVATLFELPYYTWLADAVAFVQAIDGATMSVELHLDLQLLAPYMFDYDLFEHILWAPRSTCTPEEVAFLRDSFDLYCWFVASLTITQHNVFHR